MSLSQQNDQLASYRRDSAYRVSTPACCKQPTSAVVVGGGGGVRPCMAGGWVWAECATWSVGNVLNSGCIILLECFFYVITNSYCRYILFLLVFYIIDNRELSREG